MKAIYIHDTKKEPFTVWIMQRIKLFETRNTNTLKACIGERVAIIRTADNEKSMVVGYADITEAFPVSEYTNSVSTRITLLKLARIAPESKYARFKNGRKWFYRLRNVEACDPYEPIITETHGFSWCEIAGPGEPIPEAQTAPAADMGTEAKREAFGKALRKLSDHMQAQIATF